MFSLLPPNIENSSAQLLSINEIARESKSEFRNSRVAPAAGKCIEAVACIDVELHRLARRKIIFAVRIRDLGIQNQCIFETAELQPYHRLLPGLYITPDGDMFDDKTLTRRNGLKLLVFRRIEIGDINLSLGPIRLTGSEQ